MDFLVNMGDTWLSNTPPSRVGRVAHEHGLFRKHTCASPAHPTQFTTRGYLTAVHNGYPAPPSARQSSFLTDRIYNNARPAFTASLTPTGSA